MPRSQLISSAANPLLKDVRRALERGALTSQGYVVAETFHLLDEALRSDCEIHSVLAAEAVEMRVPRRKDLRVVPVADGAFEKVASTESSQGVIALVRPPTWTVEQAVPPAGALVVVLDGVQDPGNAGTILRAAEAFGSTGVLFVKGSVSPFNAKTVRASAGSLFRVPFVFGMEADAVRIALQQRQLDLYAAVPAGAGNTVSLTHADLRRACAIVIGNEARGVGPELHAAARNLSIPTARVESLNAAMATGILLYEAWRQRSLLEPAGNT